MASAKNTPGTPGTPGTDPTGLSVRETEILSKAMLCLKAPPEVDYNKLAGYLGMTNPRSAGNAWGSIKKKLGFGGDAIRSGASTPASGRTASRKRKTGSEDDDEDVDEPTPTKKPRGRAAAGKKGKKSDPEDDYDDVNMSDIPLANSAKKVAAPRGKVVKKTAAKIAKEESSAEEDENSETKLIEDAGEV